MKHHQWTSEDWKKVLRTYEFKFVTHFGASAVELGRTLDFYCRKKCVQLLLSAEGGHIDESKVQNAF